MMKKMMMMALAIGLCGVAQAAAFNWGSSAMAYVQADGTHYTAAQITAGAPGGFVTLVYVPTGAYLSPQGNFNSSSDAKAGRVSATESWTWTGTSVPGSEVWANGDQFKVMFRKTDGTLLDLVYTDGASKGSLVTDTYTLSGVTADSFLGSFTFGQAGNFTAVPEPTSMALLALGAAAIGLRRKFRK